MINRRDFFKKVLLGGAALGLDTPLSSFGRKGENFKRKDPMAGCYKIIYCESDNIQLRDALTKCVNEISCEVIFEDFHSSHYLLWGCYLVPIVDRTLLDRWVWDEYVSSCNMDSSSTTCIIVDNMKHLAVPENNLALQYNLDDPASIPKIISFVKDMRVQFEDYENW